ncbi:hypothetical protein ACF0H5_001598 [Mactra antiquata]
MNLIQDLIFVTRRPSLPSNTTTIAPRNESTVVTQAVKSPKQTDGYNLAKRLQSKCHAGTYRQQEVVFGSYFAVSTHTCIIWKIGTTYLKRLYMMKKLPEFRAIINPYDIRFDKRYLPGKKISNSPNDTRFMYVRDPYERLLSGYVDKLMAPNPVYWKIIGVPAIRMSRKSTHNSNLKSFKCGHDLTFKEYITYVIATFQSKKPNPDGHFDRMTKLCNPCKVKYDFIGKMETFAEDSIELAKKLKVSSQTLNLLKSDGGKNAWLDAVKDSVHQPFDAEFKIGYKPCISFYEAILRSWRKMQVRGLIGKEDFPLKENQVANITENMFIEMAVKSREQSSSSERKTLKHNYLKEMFSTITIQDLEKIRKIYADDFNLFEYDDTPEVIFAGRE